jgi:hypothetical protein
MEIYIRRDNEEFGPYSREAALEYLKLEIFDLSDQAICTGAAKWTSVGALLGIEAASAPGRAPAGRGGTEAFSSRGFRLPWATAVATALILGVASIAWLRLGDGTQVARHGLAAMSGPAARLAATGPEHEPVVISKSALKPKPAGNAGLPSPAAAAARQIAAAAPAAPARTIQNLAPAAGSPPLAAVSMPAQPKPFDLASLASNPAAWPKTLVLRQPVTFPAVYDSQVVGTVTAPPGTVVSLVNIQGEQLTLDYLGGTQTLPWTTTDIADAVKGGLLASATPAGRFPPASIASGTQP